MDLLKEAAREADTIWKQMGRPRQGPLFDKRQTSRLRYRRKIREGQKLETGSYANDLHDALITKNGGMFWKCWKSKFSSNKNKCGQVDGLVDDEAIAANFVKHFSSVFACNNVNRKQALEAEYNKLRINYWGMPLPEIVNLMSN